MALRFERRHLSFRTWFHKRPTGKGKIPTPGGAFCILLTSDPGTDTKEIQLTSDSGTDTHCAQLTTTTS